MTAICTKAFVAHTNILVEMTIYATAGLIELSEREDKKEKKSAYKMAKRYRSRSRVDRYITPGEYYEIYIYRHSLS